LPDSLLVELMREPLVAVLNASTRWRTEQGCTWRRWP
jgi:hypothetical protein